ncbi:hypothetical protein C1H46_029805 [Malus baccata]|uniref:Uncharacterized protein n=1 Tax=Malus baccata TaxID=106549 RepID=A0A540LDU3_MALBA|nr:hypothetical protein C1H46_029805 [Malus baccata]
MYDSIGRHGRDAEIDEGFWVLDSGLDLGLQELGIVNVVSSDLSCEGRDFRDEFRDGFRLCR